jgi:hypothetical protein
MQYVAIDSFMDKKHRLDLMGARCRAKKLPESALLTADGTSASVAQQTCGYMRRTYQEGVIHMEGRNEVQPVFIIASHQPQDDGSRSRLLARLDPSKHSIVLLFTSKVIGK